MDAVIDFCARAQLDMPYAEHAASLTVGTAVTWTVASKRLGNPRSGTIVEILDGAEPLVTCAATSWIQKK